MLHEDLDPPPGRSFDLLQEDFEGSVNDFGRSEGLASSMSFLESDGEGADWYEGVRDASESHFSLVPSANLETSPQEAQPGRIASVVASERSRTALPVPALPWERGVFRSIFGDEGVSNPFDSLVLRMPMPLVPAHVPSTSKELPEPPMPGIEPFRQLGASNADALGSGACAVDLQGASRTAYAYRGHSQAGLSSPLRINIPARKEI
eukprot:s8005_g2.t1